MGIITVITRIKYPSSAREAGALRRDRIVLVFAMVYCYETNKFRQFEYFSNDTTYTSMNSVLPSKIEYPSIMPDFGSVPSKQVGGKKSKKSKKPMKRTKKYNGRDYVVHTGSRGGKYIVVKGSKVYV